MNDTIEPIDRAFKIIRTRDDAVPEVILAHMMDVDAGVLRFHKIRLSELEGNTVAVQTCVHVYREWHEAYEIELPAMPKGKAH